MIPVVAWYVAVNAAAFGLCAAARSRRTGGALSALVRLMVVARGAPGMLLSRAIWRRGPRETGPLALAWPLMWLLLHAAVLAALADRAAAGWPCSAACRGWGCTWRASTPSRFSPLPPTRPGRRWAVFAIRETALLSLALAGGALGALAAMHLCRHKIRTPRFAWACRCCWRCSARCLHGGARWGEAAGRR